MFYTQRLCTYDAMHIAILFDFIIDQQWKQLNNYALICIYVILVVNTCKCILLILKLTPIFLNPNRYFFILNRNKSTVC